MQSNDDGQTGDYRLADFISGYRLTSLILTPVKRSAHVIIAIQELHLLQLSKLITFILAEVKTYQLIYIQQAPPRYRRYVW